jgi:predicted phosphodiesterase
LGGNIEMHYVLGDIHNELQKLNTVLKQIQLKNTDTLILLGDLFDRGGTNPDPVGLYFTLSGVEAQCIWLRGNHDEWLADYIEKYFSVPERKRERMTAYGYNSFDLIKQRMTEVDMLNLADIIHGLPLQRCLSIDGKEYLFAHAMTSYPSLMEPNDYYMMGNWELDSFFLEGIEGYISVCGHTPTYNIVWKKDGRYLGEYGNSIWVNEKENVFLLDCGCGFGSGKLACMCLETGECFYSDK